MRTVVLLSLLFLLTVAHGARAEEMRKAEPDISEIKCNFQIPSDWKKAGENIYILKNFSKTYRQWGQFLGEGHQPWRLEPRNTAAACLWEFGISDNSHDIEIFADRLTEIKENQLYMLRVEDRNYYVFVIRKAIPVACKLVVIETKS